MLNPVTRAGANELVEKYIGTAYENIKLLAENLPNINLAAEAVRDASKFKGSFETEAALNLVAGNEGSYAYVDAGTGDIVLNYLWDHNDNVWVKTTDEDAIAAWYLIHGYKDADVTELNLANGVRNSVGYGTADEIRALPTPTALNLKVVLYGAQGGVFIADLTDTVSDEAPGQGNSAGVLIVANDGTRYRRQYNGWVKGEWFGASHLLTDNSPAINAALSVGPTTLGAGTFNCLSAIVIPGDNNGLRGMGPVSRANRTSGYVTRILCRGGHGVLFNGTGTNISDIYIESGIVRAASDGSFGVRGGTQGDTATKTYDTYMRNCVVYGFDKNIGIYGQGYGIKIENVYSLQNKRYGIEFDDAVTTATLTNYVGESNGAVGSYGIYVSKIGNLTIDNPVIQNQRRGIQVRGGRVHIINPYYEGCRDFDFVVSAGDTPHVVSDHGRYAHPNTGTATPACVSVADPNAVCIFNDPVMYAYNGNTIGGFGTFAAGGLSVVNRLDILDAFDSGACTGNGVYTSNAPAFFSLARNRNIEGYIYGAVHKLHCKELWTGITSVKATDGKGGISPVELLTINSNTIRDGVISKWNGTSWV